MTVFRNVVGVYIFISLFCACSLDYFEQKDVTSTSPEFVFNDATFTRTENDVSTIRVTLEELEQYSDGGYSFVQSPSFTLFDSEGNSTVVGYCDLLSSDTEKDEYTLYGNVSIVSYEHDATIKANNLRWIGEDEVFIGTRDEKVFVSVGNQGGDGSSSTSNEKTELEVAGLGFSASSVDFSYSFAGPVSGSIIENY